MQPYELIRLCDSFRTAMDDYGLPDGIKLGIAREFKATLPPVEFTRHSQNTINAVKYVIEKYIKLNNFN